MQMTSTPIPTSEALAILKHDAEALQKLDDRKLASAIDLAIAQLERGIADLESRRPV